MRRTAILTGIVLGAAALTAPGCETDGGGYRMIQGLAGGTPTTLQLSGAGGEAATVGFTMSTNGVAAMSGACP